MKSITSKATSISADSSSNLYYKPGLRRNRINTIFTLLSGLFSFVAILPLILVIAYVIFKGATRLSISLFTMLPPPPGLDGGGIGNAILGTIIVTCIAGMIAIPVGVGGGIYLAEYSREGAFSRFIRFGTNVLSGVPSIITGVFVYDIIVSSRVILGSSYSAIAGGVALSILMLPTVIKTTDEGLKLVPDNLRKGALGVGASKFVTITHITLPMAFTPIATGVVLSVARAAGETAPLIFTALFSYFWPSGSDAFFNPIATLSVLIYNFSTQPYQVQNELAWAASFILVVFILAMNILSRWIGHLTSK